MTWCCNYCCSTTGSRSIYVGYDIWVYTCSAIYAGTTRADTTGGRTLCPGTRILLPPSRCTGEVVAGARRRCRCRSRCRRRRRGRRRRRRLRRSSRGSGRSRSRKSSTLQGGGGGGGRDPRAAAVSVMCARCARSRRARAATQFCGARENLDPGEPDARRSAAIDSGGGCCWRWE